MSATEQWTSAQRRLSLLLLMQYKRDIPHKQLKAQRNKCVIQNLIKDCWGPQITKLLWHFIIETEFKEKKNGFQTCSP